MGIPPRAQVLMGSNDLAARVNLQHIPDCSPDRATGLWRVLIVRTRVWWSRGRFRRDVGGKETGRRPDNRRGQGDVAGGGRRPSTARRPRSVVALLSPEKAVEKCSS